MKKPTPSEEKYKEMNYQYDGEKITRANGEVYYPKKSKRPQRAIKLFCLECMGADRQFKLGTGPVDDVRNCSDPCCPLYDFRLGKNPFNNRVLSEEQKNVLRERLKKIHRDSQTDPA